MQVTGVIFKNSSARRKLFRLALFSASKRFFFLVSFLFQAKLLEKKKPHKVYPAEYDTGRNGYENTDDKS